MTTATIFLHKLIQDSQDYGSSDEHMVSRIFFDLVIDKQKIENLYADIKQSVGSSFESSNLEVSKPVNYKGPFNYDTYRSIIEEYYRSLIGANGSVISIPNSSNIRMRNNTIISNKVAEFTVDVAGGTW